MPFFSRSKKSQALIASKSHSPQAQAGAQDVITSNASPSLTSRHQPIDTSTGPTLNYRPLDDDQMEIRLLQISPGQDAQHIECTMLYAALRHKPIKKYETISYRWGKAMTLITVDGRLISVGVNAADAIRRVRSPIYPRVIWIDQVCINQSKSPKNVEKAKQVANMSNVYRCARQNLIWFGQDFGAARSISHTIELVIANIRNETEGFAKLFDMTHGRNKMFRRDGNSLDRGINLRPLELLFSSAWFGRLWIVQEVAMARWNTCFFGSASILLRDVLRVGIWLLYNTSSLSERMANFPSLVQALSLWYFTDEVIPDKMYNNITQSLSQGRTILQNFECTDPHDNVYALLGLFKKGQPLYSKTLAELPVDYERPLDLVFRDATRGIIEDSGSVDMLQGGLWASTGKRGDAPSWIVDFHERPHNSEGPSAFGQHFYAHDGSLSKECYWDGDPNVLRVQGVSLDVVVQCTEPLRDTSNRSSTLFFAKAYGLADLLMKGSSREFSIEMCSVFTGGSNWLRQPLTAADFADFGNWLRHMRSDSAETFGEGDQQAAHFAKAILRACHGRSFFVTRDGRLGLGPQQMAEHDTLVLLRGGSTPFALRSVGQGRYKLLGGCYMYGVMKGEAMRKHRSSAERDQVFDLI